VKKDKGRWGPGGTGGRRRRASERKRANERNGANKPSTCPPPKINEQTESVFTLTGCSEAHSYATRGGSSYAHASLNGTLSRSAASQCAWAVRRALNSTCGGGGGGSGGGSGGAPAASAGGADSGGGGNNALASLSAAAEACAQSVARVYVASLSGASASDNARACASGCALADATSRSVASAMASAVGRTLGRCGEVNAYARSAALTTALTQATNSAVTRACVVGRGRVATQATMVTALLSRAYGRALTTAAAKACACGPAGGCDCPPLPEGMAYGDQAFSDSVSAAAAGKSALTKAWADAAGLLCDGGTARASARVVLDAAVEAFVDTSTNFTATAFAEGPGVLDACATAAGNSSARASAEATVQSLGAAFASNFQSTCGQAVNALTQALASGNAVGEVVLAYGETCAGAGDFNLKGAIRTRFSDKSRDETPLSKALGDALSTVKNECAACGARPWCGEGAGGGGGKDGGGGKGAAGSCAAGTAAGVAAGARAAAALSAPAASRGKLAQSLADAVADKAAQGNETMFPTAAAGARNGTAAQGGAAAAAAAAPVPKNATKA